MANEERGEFAIEIQGVSYEMRPTYEAVQAFEGVDGMQLSQLAIAASRGGLSVRACGIIVAECVRAWGKANGNTSARGFQADVVAPLLLSQGIVDVQVVLAEMLFLAVTGGLEPSGERKAAPKNPKTADDAGSAASPAPRSGGHPKTSGAARR